MDHEEDASEWGSGRFYPLPGLRGGSVHHCNEEVGPGAGEMMMIMGGHHGGGRDSVSSQLDLIDSALPSDSDHAYDHHSSEEELEVINSTSYDEVDDEVNLPDGDDLLIDQEVEEGCRGDPLSLRGGGGESCTKRKWSQMAANRLSVESTSSSDDEVQGLLRPLSTPVEFRTSPPVDAHKPSRTQSPPPKLFLFSGSGPSPPLVSSSSSSSSVLNGLSYGAEDPGAVAAAPEGSAGASSPISSNVVSSSILTSSGSGALTMIMSGRTSGVFRGIRRFSYQSQQDNSYNNHQQTSSSSLASSISDSNGTNTNTASPSTTTPTATNESVESGIIVGDDEEGLRSHQEPSASTSTTTITNNHETPTNTNTSNNISTNSSPNLHTTTTSLSSSSTFGAFGKVTSSRHRSGSGGGSGSARESSTRKRHRHHNPRHIQRPWLDFEKMQQVTFFLLSRHLLHFSYCPTFSR